MIPLPQYSIRKSFALSAVGLALAATVASAQSTNSDVTSPKPKVQTVTVKSTVQVLNSTDTFTIPSFDSSLGQLASVSVGLQTNGQVIQLFSTSNPTANFSNCTFVISGSPGGSNTVINSVLAGNPDSTIPGTRTRTTGNGGAGTISNPNTSVPSFSTADFDLWSDQANGVVSLTFDKGVPNYQTTDFGNGLIRGTHSSNRGTFTVTYSYVTTTTLATPEPSTKALSALAALAGVALVVIRRRKSSSVQA